MIEIRWHGRGGQGVVTSSRLLALAAIYEGKYAIHIPEFGPERRGAPVRSFTRIDDDVIEIRYGVLKPDVVVIIDPTLISYKNIILEGLKKDSRIILNDPGYNCNYPINGHETYTLDAYHIAMDTISKPIYNTAMLGALLGVVDVINPKSVIKAVKNRFSGDIALSNEKAVIRGMKEVRKVE